MTFALALARQDPQGRVADVHADALGDGLERGGRELDALCCNLQCRVLCAMLDRRGWLTGVGRGLGRFLHRIRPLHFLRDAAGYSDVAIGIVRKYLADIPQEWGKPRVIVIQ